MTAPDLLADLDARGLLHDSTDREALAARIESGPITLYYGCDPTADSLHVGNLIGLLVLRHFQEAGHRPIALAGGATGMIGDPSGRSDERNLLDDETLGANMAAIGGQLTRLLDFEPGPSQAQLVDNRSWTGPVTLLEFLRDVGKHVTVNQMMAKESVKARLQGDQGISYTEFSYMLLQANDYWWLNEHEGCELQIGGSDQWGNITAGIDLIRRRSARSAHGWTWPLITRADGSKFGKSAAGENVWLAANRTTPYQFFQYWMHVPDDDVERFLLQLTLLPVEEATAVAAAHAEAPQKRDGQRRLARELTTLIHGAEQASAAEAASAVLFGGPLEGVDSATIALLAEEVPATRLPAADLAGAGLVDLLVRTGVASSNKDARRLLDQGGVSVNNVRAAGDRVLEAADLSAGYVLLRRGKDSYHLVLADG